MWKSKYRAKKVEIDGRLFDSKKEGMRYVELKALQKQGAISELMLQVKFRLIDSQYWQGKCVERPVDYIADFTYYENGVYVVEDVKGVKTPEYVIKRKLMLERYGIRIRET